MHHLVPSVYGGQASVPPFPSLKDLAPHPFVHCLQREGDRGRPQLTIRSRTPSMCQMFLNSGQYYNVLPHIRDLSKSPSLSMNSSRSLIHFIPPLQLIGLFTVDW